MVLFSVTLLTGVVFTANGVIGSNTKPCDTVNAGYTCDPSISHSLGQYSPYFAVSSSISPLPPAGCQVTFVNVLSRHGDRDPTASKTVTYRALIAGIQRNATSFPGEFEFLKSYNYTLGADDLTDAGRQQLVNSGVQFAGRYKELLHKHKLFVRSSGSDRVVESAQKWLAGVATTLKTQTGNVSVIIPESSTSNNTLNHDTCPAFEDGIYSTLGSDAQKKWTKVFVPPIQNRVNSALGLNLTSASVIGLMDMCPFDTIASPDSTISRFCALFTESEWQGYDYYQTLGKFYGHGAGNPLGATQGVGYVNELLARLTETPVKDHTNTNTTLDSDPATFPLHSKVYADFSHDNDMSSVFAAMGLYNITALSNTTIQSAEQTGYSAAWTVSFGARTYVEKLQCGHSSEEFVRVIVNDRVHPLGFCGGDEFGRCKLGRFVESQGFSRGGGEWARCYE